MEWRETIDMESFFTHITSINAPEPRNNLLPIYILCAQNSKETIDILLTCIFQKDVMCPTGRPQRSVSWRHPNSWFMCVLVILFLFIYWTSILHWEHNCSETSLLNSLKVFLFSKSLSIFQIENMSYEQQGPENKWTWTCTVSSLQIPWYWFHTSDP